MGQIWRSLLVYLPATTLEEDDALKVTYYMRSFHGVHHQSDFTRFAFETAIHGIDPAALRRIGRGNAVGNPIPKRGLPEFSLNQIPVRTCNLCASPAAACGIPIATYRPAMVNPVLNESSAYRRGIAVSRDIDFSNDRCTQIPIWEIHFLAYGGNPRLDVEVETENERRIRVIALKDGSGMGF